MENTLYYGDNLKVIREFIQNETIDLIYLDPPFNSNRTYNVLFKDESGISSDAQITAFDDSWHWGQTAQDTYNELVTKSPGNFGQMIQSLYQFIGANQMMAYLVMMAIRLIELHRVLKPTGSLWLHCDPTASHYLKILLDMIFGAKSFRNEIIWCYTRPSASVNQFPRTHETLFWYSKSDRAVFYRDSIRVPYNEETLARSNRNPGTKSVMGSKGKDRLNPLGKIPESWWVIPILQGNSSEKLGYPTQKPLALLERIILATSKPGDLVLDPFSGCGTCITAAQKLHRHWIGIDITHLAISMHKSRLKDSFGLEPKKDYRLVGEPEDLPGAYQLSLDDRFQFEAWAISLVEARPMNRPTQSLVGQREIHKGFDRGIDGIINFLDDRKGGVKKALVQVKSGKVNSGHIRDLKGVLDREKAQIGVFITLEPPSREMTTEALTSGTYHSEIWDRDYPKIQIVSIEELLNGVTLKIPQTPTNASAFNKAEKLDKRDVTQGDLGI